MGKCLAGDTCVFSHDPIHLASRLGLEGSSTPPPRQANLSLQDYTAFPALQQTPEHQQGSNAGNPTVGVTPPPGLKPFHPYVGVASGDRPRSRPGSRHQQHHGHHGSNSHQKESSTAPSLDDTEAFPSLGAAASSKQAGGGQGGTGGSSGKKHHGKRGGHGHGHGKEAAGAATPPSTASSLADIVKMAPSPSPGQSPSHQQSGSSSSSTSLAPPRFGGAAEKEQQRRLGRNGSPANLRNGAASGAAADGNSGGGGPNSAAAANIPSPRHIPWLETGERANKAYLKARQEAIKHGGLRNKFLQR